MNILRYSGIILTTTCILDNSIDSRANILWSNAMRRFLFIFSILIILFFTSLTHSKAYAQDQGLAVEYLIEQGINFYAGGFFEQAREKFEKVLTIDPDNIPARELLKEMGFLAAPNRDALLRQEQKETFEQEVWTRKSEVTSLSERNSDLEQKLKNLYLENTALNRALSKKEVEVDYLRAELLNLQSKYKDASSGSQDKSQILEENLRRKERELEKIKNNLKVQGESIVILEEELMVKRQELDITKNILEDEQKRISQIRKEKEALARELNLYADKVRREIESLKAKLEARSNEMELLKEKILSLREKNEAEPLEAQATVEDLQKALDGKNKELLELKSALRQKQAKIDQLLGEKTSLADAD